MTVEPTNDDLAAAALPPADARGGVDHDGARICYAVFGSGPPVILLHGAFGNGEDWGNQVPALLAANFRVILIDSRGHGRSTRDARDFSYERMALDVQAVMDAVGIARAAVVGWSDGAIIGLMLAMRSPERITRVFAFGGNMDLSGLKPVSLSNPVIAAVFARARRDYARLSQTPDAFEFFAAAMQRMMDTEPNIGADALARIGANVAIVAGEHDEFISHEHSLYLSRNIPGAELVVLPGAGHFAPLQHADMFNVAMLAYLLQPSQGPADGRV